jgi:hypothetical protein
MRSDGTANFEQGLQAALELDSDHSPTALGEKLSNRVNEILAVH